MLLSDGFGGFGGIAKFNRDFLEALDSCPLVRRVHALPRLIPESFDDVIPESIVYDREAARGKAAFLRRLLAHARNDDRVDMVICGHLNLLPAAWLCARRHGARLATVIHGIDAWSPRTFPSVLTRPLTERVEAYIAVSQYTATKFVSWSRVTMDRIVILPNCVDLNRFQPLERDPTLADRYGLRSSKVIMTVGRLAPSERYKGFDEVIDVLPRLSPHVPRLKYLIVGDGPDRPRLETKARSLGVSDQVVFAGLISEAEKNAHYNLADAYVMPSSGEGFGIVLIEAAACGLPVIGSCVDGSREALLGGRLGRLVDPNRPDELVEAILAAFRARGPSTRKADIEVFSSDNFKRRVAAWVGQMVDTAEPRLC
jgi:glycosyltransferase involved in cell wall biosynthesis